MANDPDWNDEMQRWFEAGQRPFAGDPAGPDDSIELGYEAAYPALQARHWPDAPGKTDKR